MTDDPHSPDTSAQRSRRPDLATLREITQPPAVRGRKSAEHWSGEYLRTISPYLTRLLVPTRATPNGVTYAMILCGWCISLALLLPGIWGPLLAVVLAQGQMFLDAVDGELARWRQRFSPAGIFLDRVAHYTTEGFVGLAFGLRAAGVVGGEVDAATSWMYAFAGAMLMSGIMMNKALNDLVHVARALSGMDRLPDTAEAKAVSSGGLLSVARKAARFLPFHRIFHSVELSLLALALGLVGLVVGDDQRVFQVAVSVLAPVVWVVVAGHFLAILASSRVRPQG